MHISELQNPQDLQALTAEELAVTAEETRALIIETVAKNGGYLAANLSAVELTTALCHVFDLKEYPLIFANPKLSYAFKILTGQRENFKKIRRNNGSSACFDPANNPYARLEPDQPLHNVYQALGLAAAFKTEKGLIIVIDDNDLAAGDFIGFLLACSFSKTKLIIVYNEREETFNSLGNLVKKLTVNSTYRDLKLHLKEYLAKNPKAESVLNNLLQIKNNLKEEFAAMPQLFAELSFTYNGPTDGHDLKALVKLFAKALKSERSSFMHLKTVSAKGLAALEHSIKNADALIAPFNLKTGQALAKMPAGYDNFLNAFRLEIRKYLPKDSDIRLILTKSIYVSTYLSLKDEFPSKVFCLSDPTSAVSFAAGLAQAGLKAYLLLEANEFMSAYGAFYALAKARRNVKIVLYHAGLLPFNGNAFQGTDILSLLYLQTYCPLCFASSLNKMTYLLQVAAESKEAMVLCLPYGIYKREEGQEVTADVWEYAYQASKAKAYLLTYGSIINDFKEEAEANDLAVTLIEMLYLNRFDEEKLNKIMRSKLPIIIYSETACSHFAADLKAYLYEHKAQNKVYTLTLKPDIAIGTIAYMRKNNLDREIFKEIGIL